MDRIVVARRAGNTAPGYGAIGGKVFVDDVVADRRWQVAVWLMTPFQFRTTMVRAVSATCAPCWLVNQVAPPPPWSITALQILSV
jgi:hypothetical protein